MDLQESHAENYLEEPGHNGRLRPVHAILPGYLENPFSETGTENHLPPALSRPALLPPPVPFPILPRYAHPFQEVFPCMILAGLE